MSPSKKCKEAGLSSLAELSEISTVSRATLDNWFNDKPVLFDVVLTGSLFIKRQDEFKKMKHSHYFKDCPYDKIDVYRVIDLFGVTNAPLQHALKKILCTGNRGHKDFLQDLNDIRDSVQRAIDMVEEDMQPKPISKVRLDFNSDDFNNELISSLVKVEAK